MSLQRADRKIASGRSLFKRGLEDACPPICGERAYETWSQSTGGIGDTDPHAPSGAHTPSISENSVRAAQPLGDGFDDLRLAVVFTGNARIARAPSRRQPLAEGCEALAGAAAASAFPIQVSGQKQAGRATGARCEAEDAEHLPKIVENLGGVLAEPTH